MPRAIFITGTDTGIGKTIVTACLASYFLSKNKKVAVYKPVQCGNLLKNKIKSPDLAVVKKLSGIDEKNLFNDYCFKYASSPHLAAELEHKKVDVKKIKNTYNSLLEKYDYVLVEGAGGLMVPLTKNYTVCDLIDELKPEVIVVARSGLGTINHTTLTVKALQSINANILGVIFNNYTGSLIEKDNQKIIKTMNKVKIIGTLPYTKNLKKLIIESENIFQLTS